mmetsp:Transcript_14287/g.34025  ORF Transcript_14287/g.34025 Transcript_14287/m.34025 type:complete len:327 (+) Transcript_14287:2253-3233(+)
MTLHTGRTLFGDVAQGVQDVLPHNLLLDILIHTYHVQGLDAALLCWWRSVRYDVEYGTDGRGIVTQERRAFLVDGAQLQQLCHSNVYSFDVLSLAAGCLRLMRPITERHVGDWLVCGVDIACVESVEVAEQGRQSGGRNEPRAQVIAPAQARQQLQVTAQQFRRGAAQIGSEGGQDVQQTNTDDLVPGTVVPLAIAGGQGGQHFESLQQHMVPRTIHVTARHPQGRATVGHAPRSTVHVHRRPLCSQPLRGASLGSPLAAGCMLRERKHDDGRRAARLGPTGMCAVSQAMSFSPAVPDGQPIPSHRPVDARGDLRETHVAHIGQQL